MQLAAVLLYGAAGCCVYLILFNRVLILVRDSKFKAPLILGSCILLVGACAGAGFFLYRPPWIWLPLVLFALVFVGELRRVFIRRACLGSAPVDTMPHQVPLATPITTTDFVVHRYEVASPQWRGARLRIAHLTDLHVHPSFPLAYYQEVLAAAEQTQPDIAVFTGDYVTRAAALPRLREILRPIARVQTYAVLGNHDYWAGAAAVRRTLRECGLQLLEHESQVLELDGRKLTVTGYDYPWGAPRQAVPARAPKSLHMVLSHTPDNIYRLAKASADLVFSGHYHAGQIRIPWLGSLVIPSVYGRRFDHGHFVVGGTHLFVAGGIGAANPPVRIYCQPDVFVVDVHGRSP